MNSSTEKGSYVRSADLLPPAPVSRPLTFGGITAIAGAVAWGLLVVFAHREFGLLAWGIGGAIGAVMVWAGAHGTVLALAAGGLALLSIGSGKHFAFRMLVDRSVTEDAAKLDQQDLDTWQENAAAWVALGDNPSADAVRTFARSHGFDMTNVDAFVSAPGAALRRDAADKPDLARWRERIAGDMADSASFVDYLRDDFHPADILFVFLGIATAFGLISKATAQRRLEARQTMRAAADAERDEAAKPE